jgi:hypothetical protein
LLESNKSLQDICRIKSFEKLDFSEDHLEIHLTGTNGYEYQGLLDCQNKDHSLLAYPLHVLATSRTCDTMISRQNLASPRFITDLANIRSLSGLFAGIIPYSFNFVYSMWSYQIYEKKDGLFVQRYHYPYWKRVKDYLVD